jgi:D-methionine transport system ATP-binding protein
MAQLEIRHLGKSFGGTPVLKDVSLSIEKGDVFGILGLSGAGKSTLVRCVNGLERPDAGEVLFEGQIISSLSVKPEAKIRRKIGMIFQGFGLLEQRNALENIHLAYELGGESDPDRKKSRELLAKVGLADKAKNYPSAAFRRPKAAGGHRANFGPQAGDSPLR